MSRDKLEHISPERAKQMHLEARKNEVSQSTFDGYHYRLKQFIRWCNEVEGIDDMNDLPAESASRFGRGGATMGS